jgi:hypothetical protein
LHQNSVSIVFSGQRTFDQKKNQNLIGENLLCLVSDSFDSFLSRSKISLRRASMDWGKMAEGCPVPIMTGTRIDYVQLEFKFKFILNDPVTDE